MNAVRKLSVNEQRITSMASELENLKKQAQEAKKKHKRKGFSWSQTTNAFRTTIRQTKTFLRNYNYLWKWKLIWGSLIFLGLITLDVVSKVLANNYLSYEQNPPVTFIPHLLGFSLIYNSGVAFGANQDNLPVTISVATLIVVVALICYLFANRKPYLIAFLFILAGGVGNLIDRTWNDGKVVDFIEIIPTGITFNLADLFIIVGCCLLGIVIVVEFIMFQVRIHREKKHSRHHKTSHSKHLLYPHAQEVQKQEQENETLRN